MKIVVALLRSMRPHQWVKNVLVFVPLVTAHKVADSQAWANALQAFLAMCLVVAAIYIANDLADLEADRAHRSKSRRPLASGALPVWAGIACVPLLLVAAALAAWTLPRAFLAWAAAYAAAALLYSLWLKRLAVVDVLLLALLYTVRLFAGAAAIEVPMSTWLTAFSMFFFLSLALLKRFEELQVNRRADPAATVRGYRSSDLELVAIFGVASGYLSVLVMALYTDSREIAVLYAHPAWLWGFAPLLLYWLSRMWLSASRGEMRDDPILFATTDWPSYAVVAGLGACMVLASY